MGNLGQELESRMVKVIEPWEARNLAIETTIRIMKEFEMENQSLISRVNEDITNACEQTMYYVQIDYMTNELSRYLCYKGYDVRTTSKESIRTILWNNVKGDDDEAED